MKQGWQLKRLGEVCELIRGPFGGSLKKDCFKSAGYPVYEQQNAIYSQFKFRYFIDETKFNEMKRFIVSENDLIMSCSGTIGRVAIIPKGAPIGIINQALLKLVPNMTACTPEYLCRYMESPTFLEFINKDAQGVAIKNVASVKDLKTIPIPLPPLPEQQRIVEKLDLAFAKIEELRKTAEENLKAVQDLFDASLQFELKCEGSQEKRLGEVCRFDKRQDFHSDLPYVGLEDIESKTAKFIGSLKPKNVKSSTFKFDKGYVLFGRLRPYLSKLIVPEFDGHCSTEIYPIKASLELNAYFLKYWLMQKPIIEMINDTCTGARMPRANMNQFLDFIMPLPPLEEQQRIVEKLDAISDRCRQMEDNYKQTISLCDDLKQSLLRKAFNGEL